MIIRSCYKRIGNYVMGAFVGGLGLFNATKLETRYASDSNAELFCQNGQIIFSALMLLCYAGILGEFLVMRKLKEKPVNDILKIEKYMNPVQLERKMVKEREELNSKSFDPVPQDSPKFKDKRKRNKKTINKLVSKKKKPKKKNKAIPPRKFSDPVNAQERESNDNFIKQNNN